MLTEKTIMDAIKVRRKEQGATVHSILDGLAPMTYTAFLSARSGGWTGRPALSFGETTMTYKEMFDAIDMARAALATHGAAAGDTIALLFDNSEAYVVWYLALLDLGAIAVPLNTKLVAREADYILGHCGAGLILYEDQFADLVQELSERRPELKTMAPKAGETTDTSLDAAPSHRPASLEEPCAIYYTSGTTGVPKGVVHTHRSQIAATLQCPPAWEYELDPLVALAVTPLFHIAAHTIFLPVLALGGELIIQPYRTETAIQTLSDRKINSFFAVPSILMLLLEHAATENVVFPAMRSLQFGAAPMPGHKLRQVQELFPNAKLIHGMGQTESSGTLVTLASELAFDKAGSVGLAMPGTEVSIFDDKDRTMGVGEVGELVARGPNVMKEYFKDAEATASTMRGGWLHTGDLGYRDEDGFVFLVDRKKDMIIRGGENIYSIEIEDVLLSHPEVSLAAVLGKPDHLFGEVVCAFVVPRSGSGTDIKTELADHCRKNLAKYKIPEEFRVVDTMPMTATGKIRKEELKKTLLGAISR